MDKVVLAVVIAVVAGGIGAGAGVYHFAGKARDRGGGESVLRAELIDSAGTPRSSFYPGEPVHWRIYLVSEGPGHAAYQGSSCVAYGSPYTAGRDQMDSTACPADWVKRDFPPGDHIVGTGSWDQVCRRNCSQSGAGKQVPAGDYFLWAMSAGEFDGKYAQVEVPFRIE